MEKFNFSTKQHCHHFSNLVLLLILQFVFVSSQSFQSSSMFLGPLCDLNERLLRKCARLETSAKGLLKCSLVCNLDNTCVGVSTDREDNCYVHQECPDLVGSCFMPNPDHRYAAKNCPNNGAWVPSENRCRCVGGMTGKNCYEHPRRCGELQTHGYPKGTHDVILDPTGKGSGLVRTRCELDGHNYKAVLFLHTEGVMDFNKTWAEYRNGFETDRNNFWIGLENIHQLTQHGRYELMLKIVFKFELTKEEFLNAYTDFKLSDEEDGYRLSFQLTSPFMYSTIMRAEIQFGDCLSEIRNTSFSTWDMDNDGEPSRNCASEIGSGWWFSDCLSKCNVFGYYPTVSSSHPTEQQMRLLNMNKKIFQIYKDNFAQLIMVGVEMLSDELYLFSHF